MPSTETAAKPGPTRESGNAYDLRAPCVRCPFRIDVEPYLRGDRAASIAEGLRSGGQFTCHATTVNAEVEDAETGETFDERVEGPNSKFCAGAMATMEREDAPNQMMRIGESLGLYDPTAMRGPQPVHESLSAWVRAVREHEQGEGPDGLGAFMVTDPDPLPGTTPDRLPMTHCEVVGEDCEDPAGYAGPGGAHDNDDEPTCNPFLDTCGACGNTACPACRSATWSDEPRGERLCAGCKEDADEFDADEYGDHQYDELDLGD